jgi:hypothetical protein
MVILTGVKTLLVVFILYHTTSKNSGSFDPELVVKKGIPVTGHGGP